MLPYVFPDRVQRFTNGIRIRPEIHFPARFFAPQHAGLAQYPQVVRYRSTRQRRRRNDLADIKALSGLEHQHDSLPMRVTQRHKNPGDAPPCLRNRLAVCLYHSYMTSRIVFYFTPCQIFVNRPKTTPDERLSDPSRRRSAQP